MSRSLRLLFACAAAVMAVVLAAPAAHAAFKAPCIPGQKRPTCTFWPAKVRMIADGDTIKAVLDDDRSRAVQLVRFNGINAMELTHYSTVAKNRRGACHGVQAANFVAHYVKLSHWHVRLAAQHASSKTGGRHRLRRSVWVNVHGRWTDLAKLEMQAGLALWLPNPQEWAHDFEYHQLAEEARLAQRGLYNPASCGVGPDQDVALAVAVNWDADGNDEANKNGEYVDVYNNGLRAISLAGWWIRDSWLRYNAHHVPGYEFPAGTVLPAGGFIRVHMGHGTNDGHDFFWPQTRSVFENVTHDAKHIGDGGYLFDPQGDLRASSMYPCVVSCADPIGGAIGLTVHPKTPESIEITNHSPVAVDLQGHVLKLHNHGRPDSFVWGYTFGPGTVLQPGQSMEVDPGGRAASIASPLLRQLGHGAFVLSDNGGVVSLRTATDIVTACASWGFGRCR
jgi:endonuclease YncB( thermonuclease family)